MTSGSAEPRLSQRQLLPWAVAASLLLHGFGYAGLGAAPAQRVRRHQQTLVRFEVTSSPPVAAAPQPTAPPGPPKPTPRVPAPRAAPPPAAPPPAAPPPVAPAPPPVAAEPPASQGVTLAADNASNAFAMPLGDGGSLEPTRAPAPAPPRTALPVTSALPARAPSEPLVVAPGDLSARPSPPRLGATLERNYPADARRRGLSGTAKVRARIDPDGVVRRVTLLEESAAGFGTACTRTLSGSRWAAPKDKAGRSVATEIRYTCRFVVQP